MARILTIANQKGGVGKTTTVLNLGIALSRQQRRVLLVDLDPQASLTALTGFDPYEKRRSTYSLLMFPETTVGQVMVALNSNLALIPASIDLAVAAVKLVRGEGALDRLRAALYESRVVFDDILIDTPPGLDALTAVGLIAADDVIIPVQCSRLAMLGVRAMYETMQRIGSGKSNPDLRLLGVLPTLFDPNHAYSADILHELHAVLPGLVFDMVIPYDPYVADAPHTGKPVIDYTPDSAAADAYLALAELLSTNY